MSSKKSFRLNRNNSRTEQSSVRRNKAKSSQRVYRPDLFMEGRLEDRCLLAYTTVGGSVANNVSWTGDSSGNPQLVLSGAAGFLTHNQVDPGFAGPTDFDSGPGVLTIAFLLANNTLIPKQIMKICEKMPFFFKRARFPDCSSARYIDRGTKNRLTQQSAIGHRVLGFGWTHLASCLARQ